MIQTKENKHQRCAKSVLVKKNKKKQTQNPTKQQQKNPPKTIPKKNIMTLKLKKSKTY